MITINKKRESGVELLKILAIFGIILCHTYTAFTMANNQDNILFFDVVTFSSLEYFIFQIVISFGYLGNMIFYVCSSWYLCSGSGARTSKVLSMLIHSEIISILFFAIFYLCGYNTTSEYIVNRLLPTTGALYWYIGCYILLYIFHPYLNILINNLSKKQHFVLSAFLFLLYFIYIFFFRPRALYIGKLLTFVSVYIIVAYCKKYLINFCDDLKKNIILFVIVSLIYYGIRFYNFAISPVNMEWHEMNNPFFFLMSFALLNIFRKCTFHSNLVNVISGLTLFIYMFQAELLSVINDVYPIISISLMKLGTGFIVIKVVFFALLLFVASIILSYIYYLLFNKPINKLSIVISDKLNAIVDRIV